MSLAHTLAAHIAAARTSAASPFIVAICGGADTGKSTLAARLCLALRLSNITADWISTDAFLKNRAERNSLGMSGYNPSAIDANELFNAIRRLLDQQDYTYFPYDNRTGTSVSTSKNIAPESVIVLEGIHAFHASIARHCDLRVFIDSDASTLRAMRLRANKSKRGMNETEAAMRLDDELLEYQNYVLPRKSLANLIVNVSAAFDYELCDGEASCQYDAMTKNYAYCGYGQYSSDFPASDEKPYAMVDALQANNACQPTPARAAKF